MRAAIIGIASAAAVAFAPAAQAQAPSPFTNIPITGTSTAGAFAGTFNIDHFEARGGRVFAVGSLVGTLAGQAVSQTVALPVRGATNGDDHGRNRGPGGGDDDLGGFGALTPDSPFRPTAFGGNALVIPAQAVCPVLNLTLGPLDLNLLGLVVHLNQVVLNINAQPGQGQLLGNLLCAVANLLNGVNFNGLLAGAVANLLTTIQQVLAGLGI